jgi:hypothetical protein
VRRLRLRNSRYIPRPDDIIINWGSSTLGPVPSYPLESDVSDDPYYGPRWVNHPDCVARAVNKVKAFETFTHECEFHSPLSCPPSTVDRSVAESWLADGQTVVARALLTSRAGRGITLVMPGELLPDVPLYTMYIKKRKEFRLHVCHNSTGTHGHEYDVIDIQEKRRRNGVEVNNYIRSHDNGWVFCRRDIEIDDRAKTLAIDAVRAFGIGMQFGAVDMIWNEHYDKYYVLEVNTAPGLDGESSPQIWARALNRLVNNV